jgi:toxin-antitoxin system PIN domain toxin
MAGIVDTNILLYAANRDAAEHTVAREFLLRVGTGPDQWYLTEGILYEFLRVATHPKVFAQPLTWQEAIEFIRRLVDNPRFRVLAAGEQHWSLLGELLAHLTHPSGNLFFDIRTAVLMREHGVREIYTSDVDFLQFPGLKAINPMQNDARR